MTDLFSLLPSGITSAQSARGYWFHPNFPHLKLQGANELPQFMVKSRYRYLRRP